MKAEVKKTGKIVEVFEALRGNICRDEMQYLDRDGNSYSWEDLEFILPETLDQISKSLFGEDSSVHKLVKEDTSLCDLWEQRRYEISKDVLSAIIAKSTVMKGQTLKTLRGAEVVGLAIAYADTLIKKLKE